jgi:dUTP pyrophosphatase
VKVKYKLVEAGAVAPFRKHESDAGLDLCVAQGGWILPGETIKLSTGLSLELPPGTYGDIRARSSTTLRGLAVAGVVDSAYRGICYLLVTNLSAEGIVVKAGERVAQMIVTAIPRVELVEAEELSSTDRGAGGFGSTNT